MAFSYVLYTGNGSTANYTFPFPYINADDIKVRVNGVLTGYTFLNESTVTISPVPANGSIIEIRRETLTATPPVDFEDGSVLLEKDLDLIAKYNLYTSQESYDIAADAMAQDVFGNLDAQNRRIVNVANPVNPGDALNKGTLDAVYPAVQNVSNDIGSVKIVGSDLGSAVAYESDLGSITDPVTSNPSDRSFIKTVANNITSVNTVASNIGAVNGAQGNAESAASSAASAATSASNASNSAATATTQASIATTKASEASASATATAADRAAVSTLTSQAGTSAAQAANSANSANQSANTATAKAGEAFTYATNAANSASAAANSADVAENVAQDSSLGIIASDLSGMGYAYDLGSITSPAAGVPSSPPGNIVTVAQNISSVNTAATNITAIQNAPAAASSAASSASAASTSASQAATSASNASSSASSASASATAAATSETNAQTAKDTAVTQAGIATTKASEASTSASNAATSASNASSSASAASGSASAAASSASDAAASAAATAALLDNFDDRYLGPKSSAPTVDNDGNALIVGALYFDTTTGKMRVYTSTGWIDASAQSQAALTVFRFTATAGQTTFSGSDVNGITLAYTAGGIVVSLNGAVIVGSGVDYTASNGTSVVLASGASSGDTLEVYAFASFSIASLNGSAIVDDSITASKLAPTLDLGSI